MKKNILLALLLTTISLFHTGCEKDEDKTGFNLFTIEDDKKLGEEVKEQVESDTSGYVILDSAQNVATYQYLYGIRNYILVSGRVQYKDEFAWRVRIIVNDTVLNAFAAPGGYIYVYTGLIKYLDSEDHLAGVLAHEFAHADRRHSTTQLTKQYGIGVLFQVVLGENQGALSQIAAGLASLKFSRTDEAEADEYSVIYLCQNPAAYEADGAAGFFSKLIQEGQSGGTPEFLSSHPSPPNRVQDIEAKAVSLGCDTTPKNPVSYQTFKNSLP